MSFLEVGENERGSYRTTGIMLMNQKCLPFIKIWRELCFILPKLVNIKKYATYHEETIYNVLSWKKTNQGFPLCYINLGEGFETVKHFYSDESTEDLSSNVDISQNFYKIPDNKRDIKVLHGEKRTSEVNLILDYLLKLKKKDTKSLNVLLTTIGRDELKSRMLPSLVNQLNSNDYLTIVSDDNHQQVRDAINSLDFKCTVTHIANSEKLGFWGHGSRNKYQNNLLGDYILNADDDDSYVDGCFDFIRSVAIENKLYLFKFQGGGEFFWRDKIVCIGNIGTPCGVIPNNKNLPYWEHFYGGDGTFYVSLANMIEVEFVDYVIYKVRDIE
jgi:hypothetical protein